MEITSKVAFITGGGSGIGRATAQRLASEGASVMIADLDQAMGEESLALLERAGAQAGFIKLDVTDADQMKRALDETVSRFGRLDILHNNAGIALGRFPELEIEQWRRVLDIDLQAVILGCYLGAPIMQKAGGGVIINTASMAGLYPHPSDPIYGACKAGVVAFTYALTPWASERGIRVNCICPGIVDTPLVQRGQAERKRLGMPTLSPHSMLKAEQIAAAVVTLISDDNLFGRAIEIRPSGPRLVERPRMPGERR